MYQVSVENKGISGFLVKSPGYEFMVDSEGKGISPPSVLLAGLGSCIGVYIRKYFKGAKIDLGEFSVKLEAQFSQDAPIRFSDIHVTIEGIGNLLDARRKDSFFEFIKNCPVHNTLKNNPVVEIKLV